MKELSIEEKAKANDGNYKTYTELINRLEDVKDAIKKQNYGIAMDILYKPYPEFQIITLSSELKESEGERIRKWLIYYFTEACDNVSEKEKKGVIAWLEKQGNLMKALQEANKEIGELVEENYYLKEKQGEQKPFSWTEDDEAKVKAMCKDGNLKPSEREWLINLRYRVPEQKPADKVESKFKVGDWIIKNDDSPINIDYICCEITKVENGNYTIESIYGYKGYNTFETFEKDYHLWTIQDAKDGDVLCGYPGADYPWIGIFHKLNTEGTFNSHCFLQVGQHGKFCPPSRENIFGKRNVDNHASENVVPATKEQRDLLFQKMKEAGYEWDAENKELKKENKL